MNRARLKRMLEAMAQDSWLEDAWLRATDKMALHELEGVTEKAFQLGYLFAVRDIEIADEELKDG